MEGPNLARAGRTVWALGETEVLNRGLVGKRFVPREEPSDEVVDRATDRGRDQSAIRGEEVDVEVFEGHLRKVIEVDRDLAGSGVGLRGAHQLGVHAEAVEDHEEAVLVAGFGLTEVERTGQPPIESGRADADGPDLRVIGTVG